MNDLGTNAAALLDELLCRYAGAGVFERNSPTQRFAAAGAEEADTLRRLLLLFSALLRNAPGDRPPAVAVFGGTQVGKSTCVNMMASGLAAGVSHLAGYTRHPHAYIPATILPDELLGEKSSAFRNFQQVGEAELRLEIPLAYSVTTIRGAPELAGVVLWDAPDCDAVDNSVYLPGLLEAVAASDAIVYVTSKEKYAENAVLELLATLLQCKLRAITFLNMTPETEQGDIIRAMDEALGTVAVRHELQVDLPHPVIAAEYLPDGNASALAEPQNAVAVELRSAVAKAAVRGVRERPLRFRKSVEACAARLSQLLAPARAELAATRDWEKLTREAAADFVATYQRDYLEDPKRYDAFRRVGLEILNLLNPPIPGLKKALAATRTILSLPARIILKGGRALWSLIGEGPTKAEARERQRTSAETQALSFAHERAMNRIMNTAIERAASQRAHPVWRIVHERMKSEMQQITLRFHARLSQHLAQGEQWTRDAARSIYEELAKNPVKLNLLRTGRIAGDAGAIIVSLKTGGHGDILHDIIVAPVLMSVVEAASQQLTENYVEARKLELRERLLADTQDFAGEIYSTQMRGAFAAEMRRCGILKDRDSLPDEIETSVNALCSATASMETR